MTAVLNEQLEIEKATHNHTEHHDYEASLKDERIVVPSDFDPKAVRKLLLKLDCTILPFAVLLYLSAYLDRGNL
jgi:hypothetical protein